MSSCIFEQLVSYDVINALVFSVYYDETGLCNGIAGDFRVLRRSVGVLTINWGRKSRGCVGRRSPWKEEEERKKKKGDVVWC